MSLFDILLAADGFDIDRRPRGLHFPVEPRVNVRMLNLDKQTKSKTVALRVGPGVFATIDRERKKEFEEGPAWSFWSNGNRRFVGRWVKDENGKRRLQSLLALVAGSGPRQIVTPADGNPLNCVRANVLVRTAAIAKAPTKRKPYRVVVRIRGIQYDGGCWPAIYLASNVKAELAVVADTARREKWDRRKIREAVDRVCGRMRARKRGGK